MANLTIANIEACSVALREEEFEDGLVTFAGTDTFAAGTILARDTGTLKFVLFVKGGVTTGNGIPKGVLTYAIDRTGAGDVKARVLVKGVVDKYKLIIDADGSNVNVDAAVLDGLRDYGITTVDVKHIAGYDTQD